MEATVLWPISFQWAPSTPVTVSSSGFGRCERIRDSADSCYWQRREDPRDGLLGNLRVGLDTREEEFEPLVRAPSARNTNTARFFPTTSLIRCSRTRGSLVPTPENLGSMGPAPIANSTDFCCGTVEPVHQQLSELRPFRQCGQYRVLSGISVVDFPAPRSCRAVPFGCCLARLFDSRPSGVVDEVIRGKLEEGRCRDQCAQ